MTYRGRVKNGQIALENPVSLPEGSEVSVEVVQTGGAKPAIWDKLLKLAGTAEGLPPDMASNHDHYLYGLPKRT